MKQVNPTETRQGREGKPVLMVGPDNSKVKDRSF